MTFLICGIKIEMIQMNLQSRKKVTDLEKELMVARVGEGIFRGFGMDMYTLLYFKWVTDSFLYCTGNSAQCCVAAWMGGELGGEWIHVHV